MSDENKSPEQVISLSPDVEKKRYAREMLAAELQYRRDRRGGVFTWAHTLMVAIAGGIVAMQFGGNRTFYWHQRITLTLLVLAFSAAAAKWWKRHDLGVKQVLGYMRRFDEELGTPPLWSSKAIGPVDGRVAMALMSLATVIAIWLPWSGQPATNEARPAATQPAPQP